MGSHPVRLLLAATLAAGTAGLRRELANAGGAAGGKARGRGGQAQRVLPLQEDRAAAAGREGERAEE
eukprot:CAMPEP_0175545174 /NCGR_PEP_ID=MMETSP0096-20121207/29149_1 /TAXON_ID=311494 /ORGANISM="Alexandrium monilatum, Strain CCMP3105" /LENGTH=66 /DNA_ID=CAMNT_0016848135 /DNA_START=78 /DNA_END=274 /DNA_ORIENTATION=+